MSILDAVLAEDAWFPAAALIAFAGVVGLVVRYRRLGVTAVITVLCALNVFYGTLIGILGFGHLAAVTVTTVMGTSSNRWFLFPLGFGIVLPGYWLLASIGGLRDRSHSAWKRAIALNAWLVVLLLPLAGPLAVPGAVNGILLWRHRVIWQAAREGGQLKSGVALAVLAGGLSQHWCRCREGCATVRRLESILIRATRSTRQITKTVCASRRAARAARPAVAVVLFESYGECRHMPTLV
jgi:hypothetical protein